MYIEEEGKLELVFTNKNGQRISEKVFEYPSSGVSMAMFNLDKSIESFAMACFEYSLSEKIDLWFATKDTISKKYHTRFRQIFEKTYKQYESQFKDANLNYFYFLIDDAVAQVMRNEGDILWACMNYDGDVMSDMIASGFGSLGLMTSVFSFTRWKV